jgi:hypothetical protein
MPIDHASDICALQDVRNLSVMYVGEAIGDFVGDCGTIP